MATAYHALEPAVVLTELKTSKNGLTLSEAASRLARDGPNELVREKASHPFKLFISQFTNVLSLLLIVASGVSFVIGERIETIAMMTIVLVNGILGFVQEYHAERSVAALRKMAAPLATVVRGGVDHSIDAREVVVGDIIRIEAGTIIPADARILEAWSLECVESSLTGESLPSRKGSAVLGENTSVADQKNMVFFGTSASVGRALAVVTATGMSTQVGHIAHSLDQTEETDTPLQRKFAELARQIGGISVLLILCVLLIGFFLHHLPLGEVIILSLALAVATIPVALPTIVTVGLSLGSKRLAASNLLIRRLPAAESLGAVTFICTDKTGTLTKNEMTVTRAHISGSLYEITGSGYSPEGLFYLEGEKTTPDALAPLLRCAALCNDASSTGGDPTERALITLAQKGGVNVPLLREDFPRVAETPFDSGRKLMSVVCRDRSTETHKLYVKGAPDILIGKCTSILRSEKSVPLTATEKKHILAVCEDLAADALRVLAFAERESSDGKEEGLTFIGFVGMLDPPRPEVQGAIAECRRAGIEVMMITGDHPLTARAIASRIGLLRRNGAVRTGAELGAMTDAELTALLPSLSIVARALPEQKLRIVTALQKHGHIVAMTGDGVNDAPAIKKADIGIAMGRTGTGVAKEAARAILIDDNFASIVGAVREGRTIYDKMIKSAKYLLSCNSGEIFVILFSLLLFLPLPLLPIQILLINILTDAIPALGLAMEPGESNVMRRRPRKPTCKPLGGVDLMLIILFGVVMAVGTLLVFTRLLDDLAHARTAAFTALVLFQLFAVVSSRSLRPTLRILNPVSNPFLFIAILISLGVHVAVVYLPPLQALFGTVPLAPMEWLGIAAISSAGFIAMELAKLLLRNTHES